MYSAQWISVGFRGVCIVVPCHERVISYLVVLNYMQSTDFYSVVLEVCVCVCLVWCGVVSCGVVWCGVVLCGVVWRGVVWCGVFWYGVDADVESRGAAQWGMS